MSSNRKSLNVRLAQVAGILTATGATRKDIGDKIGIIAKSGMFRIMEVAVERGIAFDALARVSESKKTAERVYFATAEARDAFVADYTHDRTAKRKLLQSEASRRNWERRKEEYRAKRKAQRDAARAIREAKEAEGNAEYMAMRAAERELAAKRKRLQREAKQAENQRKRAEAKSQRERLKSETRAAGLIARLRGTASPKPVAPRGPALLDGEMDLSRARITIAPAPRQRFQADDAPALFGGLLPGQYLAPAPVWLGGVL